MEPAWINHVLVVKVTGCRFHTVIFFIIWSYVTCMNQSCPCCEGYWMQVSYDYYFINGHGTCMLNHVFVVSVPACVSHVLVII